MGLNSHLDRIAAALDDRIDMAIRNGVAHIEAEARSRVDVDTGRLRDSIHTERHGEGHYEVVAGDNDAFYGHLVEFGTSHSPPRPFLIPAAESRRDDVVAGVRAAIRGVV